MSLIGRRLVNPVFRGLKMTTRNDLEGFTDIDNQASGLVRYIDPLIVLPDLETRDRNREEQSRKSEIGMSMHFEAFCCFLSCFFDWSEDGVAEVAFARG